MALRVDQDVVVGYAVSEEAQDILDAGGRVFLQKPYQIARLSEAVEAALSDPQPTA